MSDRAIELEVLRYHPEKDEAPRFQRYSVSCPEEWVVLDVLNHIILHLAAFSGSTCRLHAALRRHRARRRPLRDPALVSLRRRRDAVARELGQQEGP